MPNTVSPLAINSSRDLSQVDENRFQTLKIITRSTLYREPTFQGADPNFVTNAMIDNAAGASAGKALYRSVGAPTIKMIHNLLDPIPDDEEYALQRQARERFYERTLL